MDAVMKSLHPFIPAQLDEAGLTPALFRVFAHLCRRAGIKGAATGSVFNIAKVCKLNHETARSAVQELEALKMIQRFNRPGRTSQFKITEMATWLPLGNEGIPSNQRGYPSGTEVGHPSETEVDKGNPPEGAATAAPSEIEIHAQPEQAGLGALPAAVAAVAPIPDKAWLSEQLSMLELRSVQLAVPLMATIELWQIADIYHTFFITKVRFAADIKKARKDRPNLSASQWFAEQVQSYGRWNAMIEQCIESNANAATKAKCLAARNAAQPDNSKPAFEASSWQEQLYEATTGHKPENDGMMYDHELAAMPCRTWDAMQPWMRALFCGNYRAGTVPNIKAKPEPRQYAR